MKFIEFEKSVKDREWSMTELHSHSHYEIYFLINGIRDFFLENTMYKISAPCIIIIPPYTMHKTEGIGFSRININISPSSLNSFEQNTLLKLSNNVISLSNDDFNAVLPLFEEGIELSKNENKFLMDNLYTITSYIVLKIFKLRNKKVTSSVKAINESSSPTVLKIIDYINTNINNEITLKMLSKKFYLSNASICSIFKKSMNCTIGEYILRLRINKAKQFLSDTKKSVEEISTLCGFSSGAYMGLIFKNKTGLSPLQYRKLQTTKI